MKMKHISLFSGIGGFDLAAEWMGWENVAHCEIDPFCRQILNYYWPNSESYDDIKTTDFTIWRGRIDILTGGFPCQPYSISGKRKGKEDERHLWPEMRRAIREIQPRWIVGENVRGIISWNGGLVFNEVQADLESEGYEVFAFVLPACGINAPHRRERVWFVAYRDGNGLRKRNCENEVFTNENRQQTFTNTRPCPITGSNTHTGSERLEGRKNKRSDGSCEKGQKKQFAGLFFDGWENFPTQPALYNGNDGLSGRLDLTAIFKGIGQPKNGRPEEKWRKESVKAGGNAIVPALVFRIYQVIEKYELEYAY